jgi:precorrin-2 methylase
MNIGDKVIVISGTMKEEEGYHDFTVGDIVIIIKIDKYIHCQNIEGIIQKLEKEDIKLYGN